MAAYAGKDIDELLNQKKPALCMEAEAEGIQILMKKLVAEHRIDGMIGMGGGQGSSVLRCAVSVLPGWNAKNDRFYNGYGRRKTVSRCK